MRTAVPVGIALVTGVLMIVEYFFKVPVLQNTAKEFRDWGIIVSAFALAVAALNLLLLHGRKIIERDKNRVFSSALVVSMLAFVFSGVFLGRGSELFKFLWEYALIPLGSSMYAMLVFHIASASYRAFRARNVDAALLLVAGVLVMLGMAPVGEAVWSKFPVISQWILDIPNLAANRGIMLGATLGAVGAGFRILLGLDRYYMGVGE